jgi:hypothetical protein
VKAGVFRRSGAAKHIGAARVGGIGAVVNEVAVENLLMFEQQEQREVFLVAQLHPQAQFGVGEVAVTFLR